MGKESGLSQRLAFLNLEESELELLAELAPLLEKHADGLVASFYRHLLSFAPTRELLRDPEVRDRLLEKQREYLLSLCDPTVDEAYLERRRRIGETHERVGLEPRWYLGAYALYLSLLSPMICEAYASDADRAQAVSGALHKRLVLDAALAMEAYMARHERRLEFQAEELARMGRRLARDYDDQSAELRQTEERARVAEELASIATLVAGLAHEIGTPMGVIQGHAKLLESAVTGKDALWRVKTIQEQIARISKIIQTLLRMARPGETRRVGVALAPLLEATLAFLTEKLAGRGIRVKTSLQAVPGILGDPERLQQLFLNLFLNAADAMPDGGELSVSASAGDDGCVEVRVGDTGVGLRAEDRERIFEPFFTTKTAGEGNGLGLMVAKGIAKDHGGTIEVWSEEGAGTEFCVRFPARPDRDPATP